MLQRAVFSLRLLPYDDQIQVIVAGAVSRQTVHMNHIGKQVQLSPVQHPTKNQQSINQKLAGDHEKW